MKYSLITALFISLVATNVTSAKTNAEQHQSVDKDTKFKDRTESLEYKNETAQPSNLSQDHTYFTGTYEYIDLDQQPSISSLL